MDKIIVASSKGVVTCVGVQITGRRRDVSKKKRYKYCYLMRRKILERTNNDTK